MLGQIVRKCRGAIHHLVPPGAKTYQIDVETCHRWLEEELYVVESFASEKEFLRKAGYYQAWFNCKRHKSYKGNTSLNLMRETYPALKTKALVF